MATETTRRDEIQAMERKYNQVLRWEEEFTKEIAELSKIDESDKEAKKVALELVQAWETRKNIRGKRTVLAFCSNSKRIRRLEEKLKSHGYELIKSDWDNDIEINKINI
ncbi:MAG: hypothetical protein ACQEXX_01780 [Bacillota bacterium]